MRRNTLVAVVGLSCTAVIELQPDFLEALDPQIRVALTWAFVMLGAIGILGLVFDYFDQPSSHSSASHGEFSYLSDALLQQEVIKFAMEMRNFEMTWEARQPQIQFPVNDAGKSTKALDRYVEKLRRKGQQKELEYKNLHYGKARSLMDELIRRVGLPVEGSFGQTMLVHGRLAGPQPVSAAADFLESLARKLPSQRRGNA